MVKSFMVTYAYLLLSALGFLDAAFLTIQHYSRDPFACPLFGGCEQVTTSIYSEVFGVPVALLGTLYYALIFILTLISYLTDNKKLFFQLSHLSIAGLLSSMYLVFIMVGVLGALCFYCLISATTSTLLFVLFIVNWLSWKRQRLQSVSVKN